MVKMIRDHWRENPSICLSIQASISVPIATCRIASSAKSGATHAQPAPPWEAVTTFTNFSPHTLAKPLSATATPTASSVHLPTSSFDRLQFLLQNQVQLLLLPFLPTLPPLLRILPLLAWLFGLCQWTAAIRPRRSVDSKSKEEKVNAISRLTHLSSCILDEVPLPKRSSRILALQEME